MNKPVILPPLPLDPEDDICRQGHGLAEFEATRAMIALDLKADEAPGGQLVRHVWRMKEAWASSAIEGIETSLEELFLADGGVSVAEERREAVQDVLNCRDALNLGLVEIAQGRDFSLSLVKELHACLLQGPGGAHKTPGQWRTRLVHLGKAGSTMEEALYVPPDPTLVLDLLENWVRFAQRRDLHPIVQAAILHAQFEMIHPFLDGNGRMGRILVPLFLVWKGVIARPVLLASLAIWHRRQEYYERLLAVSGTGDWSSWIAWFLDVARDGCRENMRFLAVLDEAYVRARKDAVRAAGSQSALRFLEFVLARPVFTIPEAHRSIGIHVTTQTVSNFANAFEKAGLIDKVMPGKGRTPAIWRFSRLMELAG